MLRQQRPEAHRFVTEVPANEIGAIAGRVALVEPEVEDLEHRVQALG